MIHTLGTIYIPICERDFLDQKPFTINERGYYLYFPDPTECWIVNTGTVHTVMGSYDVKNRRLYATVMGCSAYFNVEFKPE